LGLVVGLDYRNPYLDPHQEFQRFKTHPFISPLLKGAKLAHYGAKAIPEGGYYSMPRSYLNGGLIIGDAAGLLNSQRLKGIHLAMKSGMLAAETICTAFDHQDFSSATLRHFEDKVNHSWIYDELHPVRNFHAAFQRGRWSALLNTGLQYATGGLAWGYMPHEYHVPGYQRMEQLNGSRGTNLGPSDHLSGTKRYANIKFDKQLTFDKITDVYHGAVAHDEDQPSHLHVLDTEICATRCAEEYGNPCQRFCPAAVYEMEQNPATGRRELKVNFSNCVHCKTCDIADPYQIINWVPPEGGGGPNYKGM